jgi:ribosomal-protein-alanine acetyltransferase
MVSLNLDRAFREFFFRNPSIGLGHPTERAFQRTPCDITSCHFSLSLGAFFLASDPAFLNASLPAPEHLNFIFPLNTSSERALPHRPPGSLIGMVFQDFFPPEADITQVGVDPEFQNFGIAAELVAQAMDSVQDVSDFYLEVRESNAAAKKLYKKLGFLEVSKRRAYYTEPIEDAVVMRRSIPVSPKYLST